MMENTRKLYVPEVEFEQLAKDMIANLNGDRLSDYFVLARGLSDKDAEVSVSLIEEKSELDPGEAHYTIPLIDGVNGLSSGFCVMACAIFGVFFYCVGNVPMVLLAAVSAGALIPFFSITSLDGLRACSSVIAVRWLWALSCRSSFARCCGPMWDVPCVLAMD